MEAVPDTGLASQFFGGAPTSSTGNQSKTKDNFALDLFLNFYFSDKLTYTIYSIILKIQCSFWLFLINSDVTR